MITPQLPMRLAVSPSIENRFFFNFKMFVRNAMLTNNDRAAI